ncbi:unnamed protein product [Discula destructiva]
MYSQSKTITIALLISPLVSAHGKIAAVTGDAGGNGTALGIKGAVVPGFGPNYKTEVDTTVFWSKDIDTDDDIGFTEDGSGNNQLTDLVDAMALSGNTLAQVSSGGSVSGTYHVVTDDGCGPLEALIDDSASAKWSTAAKATVSTEMPGTDGDCPSSLANDSGDQNKIRRMATRALAKMGLVAKRADNVNKDYDFSVAIPAGTTCTGTIGDQSNLCLVKISNNNANGPFGGVFAVQMGGNATTRRVMRSFVV